MGRRTTICSPHCSSHDSLPWSLFYMVMLLPVTGAQSVEQTPSASTSSPVSPALTFRTETLSSHAPLSTAPPRSTVFPSNSTTSSSVSAPTNARPELFPPAAHSSRGDGVFNYYFLFLALFGVLTAIFLCWLHKRRKLRKEQMRLSGHNALARDMDGWINTRRWLHGARRHNRAAAFVRREEGLNEHGEAPPPYEPKSDGTVVQTAAGLTDRASGLSIPLRTLSRDSIAPTLPPDYRASFSRDSNVTRTIPAETDPINHEPSSRALGRSLVAQVSSTG